MPRQNLRERPVEGVAVPRGVVSKIVAVFGWLRGRWDFRGFHDVFDFVKEDFSLGAQT